MLRQAQHERRASEQYGIGDLVTGRYTINFPAPANRERLRSKAIIVEDGKRQTVVQADIWAESDDEAPRRCALAQATIAPVG